MFALRPSPRTSPLPLPREVWRASALRRVTSPFPRPRVVRRASALRRVTSPFPLPPGGPEGLSPPPRYQSASSSPGGPEGLSPPPRQRPSPLPRVVWRGRSPFISNRGRRRVRRERISHERTLAFAEGESIPHRQVSARTAMPFSEPQYSFGLKFAQQNSIHGEAVRQCPEPASRPQP